MTRDKIIRATLVLLLLLLFGATVWILVLIARGSKIRDLEYTAKERLHLYRSTIQSALERYRYLPYLLSENQKIINLVSREEHHSDEVNHSLEKANSKAGSAVLFIMNRKGYTVAASNWKSSVSFMGHNYAFRPYFKNALLGKEGGFYAVGVTTGKAGYFMSYPIRNQEQVQGAAVVKVDLAPLQKIWRESGENVFVTDRNGVIFLAGNEQWNYRSIVPLTHRILDRIRSGQQYKGAELSTLPMKNGLVSGAKWIRINQKKFLWSSLALDDLGWTLHYLHPWKSIEKRMQDSAVLAVTCLILSIMVLLLIRGHRLKKNSRVHALEAKKIRHINTRLQQEVEERRRTELELLQTQDELVQAGKLAALGRMSAAIVHELNQPISAIRTYSASCKVMLEKSRTENLPGSLQAIDELTDRMTAITGQLKSFSRKSPLKIQKLDMRQPVQKALALLKYSISDIECVLQKELTDQPQWVMGDELRLEQVFINLVRNGLDALVDCEKKIITVTIHADTTNVEVSVTDSGPGISLEIGEQIFEPFFTTRKSGDGLGLGLYISRSIIKDMHGDIRVSNTVDAGACFTVQLPLYSGEEHE